MAGIDELIIPNLIEIVKSSSVKSKEFCNLICKALPPNLIKNVHIYEFSQKELFQ